MRTLSRRRHKRRGTTAVEAAFVLPVFFFFLLALIEFSHAVLVQNVLHNATRSGARFGSTEGATSAAVESAMRDIIAGAVDPQSATIFVKDAGVYDEGGSIPSTPEEFEGLPALQLDEAEPRQLFMIRAKVTYSDVALVPMPFMDGITLDSQAFMRHE